MVWSQRGVMCLLYTLTLTGIEAIEMIYVSDKQTDKQEVKKEKKRNQRSTLRVSCLRTAQRIFFVWVWHLAQAPWDTLTSYLNTHLNDLLTHSHTWHHSERARTVRRWYWEKEEGRAFNVFPLCLTAFLISKRTSWQWRRIGVRTRIREQKHNVLQAKDMKIPTIKGYVTDEQRGTLWVKNVSLIQYKAHVIYNF